MSIFVLGYGEFDRYFDSYWSTSRGEKKGLLHDFVAARSRNRPLTVVVVGGGGGHHIQQIVFNPAYGQLNREGEEFSLDPWSRERGSAVPSRVSPLILHAEAESGAYS